MQRVNVLESQEKKKEVVAKENDLKSDNSESNESGVGNAKEIEPVNASVDNVDVVDNVQVEIESNVSDKQETAEQCELDEEIRLLKAKINGLISLRDKLLHDIEEERSEITDIKKQLTNESNGIVIPNLNEANSHTLDEIMHLLYEENQVLQIKKLNLVRQIMEQHEVCVDLRAKLEILTVT